MRGKVQQLVRWTMAVWMLMASIASTMAYVHTHDEAAHHDHVGGLCHGHAQRHCENLFISCSTDSFAGPHRHAHIWLFGAEMHVPLPVVGDPLGGPADESSYDLQLGVLLPQVKPKTVMDFDWLRTAMQCESERGLRADSADNFPTIGDFSEDDRPTWLCDRARHERSGVQLF